MSKIAKYLKAIPLIAITAIICILCFTACGEDTGDKLATPVNLRIADEVLTWDEVENASGYEVDIDGQKYQTETNSLDVLLLTISPKTYNMRVMAYADFGKYGDSEWSDSVECNVDFPSGLTVRPINNDTEYEVAVIDKSAISGKVIIPPYFSDGKYITQISKFAFRDCKNITSVVIPDTITNIENSAFENCTSLTRVKLPAYIEEIGGSIFENCEKLIGITLPRTIKEISNNAFNGCKSLTEIFIPDLVEYIGNSTFSHTGIKSITVDEGNYDFKSDGNCIIKKATDTVVVGCNGSVIPDYVREIKSYAFSGCELLDRIEIPNSVTKIGNYAFYGCESLEKIDIPNSVTKIGSSAFNGCNALTEVTVPGSVEEILSGTFSNCKSLKKVTFENGVKSIVGGSPYGGGAFTGCTALESVQLPKTLESISPYAFFLCASLKSAQFVVIDEENEVLKAEGLCIINKADNEVVWGCDYSVVPNYVKSIGQHAFACCSFSRILIKDNKKPDSYYENDGTTLYLPEGLEAIKNHAFVACEKLIYANLPKSVVEVENDAFIDCGAFSSVIVGENLRAVGSAAFYGALVYTSLKECSEDLILSTHGNILCGCEFGEEDGQPYLISYTAKRYINEDGTYTFTCCRCSDINIPYRVGYTFMGFATEEGSDEVTYAVRYHAGGTYKYYYAVSFDEFYSMNKDGDGTTLYAVWQPTEE